MPQESTNPSMETIANAAGVATSTVSRALRGDPRISENTRKRICQLTEKLGYRPNPLISALMTQLRHGRPPIARCNLAWLDFLPNDEWQRDRVQQAFYAGACERARHVGYAIYRVDAHARPMARLVRLLRNRGIRGILLPFFDTSQGIAANIPLPLDEFTFVGVGTRYEDPALHYCSDDQYECSRLAVKELWSRGYRRIGYVGEPRHEKIVNGRFLAGHQATLQNELGGIYLPPLLTNEDSEIMGWIRTNRPEAVVTANRRLWTVLHNQGVRVPADVAFAHLNVDAVQDAEPGTVAGIRQDNTGVGANAVELLVSLLYHNEVGVPIHPCGVQINGTWVEGASAPQRSCLPTLEPVMTI